MTNAPPSGPAVPETAQPDPELTAPPPSTSELSIEGLFASPFGEISESEGPSAHPNASKIRVLLVFAELTGTAAERHLIALARQLPRALYHVRAICFGPQDQAASLTDFDIPLDPCGADLSLEGAAAYLRRKMTGADLVILAQNCEILPLALAEMAHAPPVLTYATSTAEIPDAELVPGRIVTPNRSVATKAASDLAQHIPPILDFSLERGGNHQAARLALGMSPGEILIGWTAPTKDREVDFVTAATILRRERPALRFLNLSDPDAPPVLPEPPKRPATTKDALAALDLMVWLGADGDLPALVAQAGAQGCPLVAVSGETLLGEIEAGWAGIVVPDHTAAMLSKGMRRLVDTPLQRRMLGASLRQYRLESQSPAVILPRWQGLFDQLLEAIPPAPAPQTFSSYLLGDWGGSSERLANGERRDPLAATAHDSHAAEDYRQLAAFGLTTARDSLSWPRIEAAPGEYDLSQVTPLFEAARDSGTEVVWDLMHFGWPDDIDIWRPDFVTRFGAFAHAMASHFKEISDSIPTWCPIYEISRLAHEGGEALHRNPFAQARGFELKCNLVRAAMAAIEALREVDPRARILLIEPLSTVIPDQSDSASTLASNHLHEAQFEIFELMSGKIWPQLGGKPGYLDMIGLTYGLDSQKLLSGAPIDIDDARYQPLSDLLFDVSSRYGRPLVLAGTGAEGQRRGPWFDYVSAEATRARRRGVPIEGICLSPIADLPDLEDSEALSDGLFGPRPGAKGRSLHRDLAKRVVAFGEDSLIATP